MICANCTATIEPDVDACPECSADPLLEGRYRLLNVLGQGGQATTYRAERVEDGAEFAIKEVMVRRIESAKAFELFDREARVLETLQHHGIPRYIEDFQAGEGRSIGLYLVQDFVAGKTLQELVQQQRFSEEEVRSIMIEVLDILQYLHKQHPPVIHRDIKPGNLIRRANDERLALIDFGAVRDVLRGALEDEPALGGGDTVAGTFGFMAPEQFGGDATPATDIYGLGATAVALLSRQDPAKLISSDHKLGWRTAVGQISPHTRSVLERMLAPDPQRRAQDAGALLNELLAPPQLPAQRSTSAHGQLRKTGGGAGHALVPMGRRDSVPAVSGEPPREVSPPVLQRYGRSPHIGHHLAGGLGALAMIGMVGDIVDGAFVIADDIGGLLIVIGVLLFGVFGWTRGLRDRRASQMTLRDGVETTGHVVDLKSKGPTYRITFSYDVSGARYVSETFHRDAHRLRIGQPVPVFYRADDPREAEITIPLAALPG